MLSRRRVPERPGGWKQGCPVSFIALLCGGIPFLVVGIGLNSGNTPSMIF